MRLYMENPLPICASVEAVLAGAVDIRQGTDSGRFDSGFMNATHWHFALVFLVFCSGCTALLPRDAHAAAERIDALRTHADDLAGSGSRVEAMKCLPLDRIGPEVVWHARRPSETALDALAHRVGSGRFAMGDERGLRG